MQGGVVWRLWLGMVIASSLRAANDPLEVPLSLEQAFEQVHQGRYPQALAALAGFQGDFPKNPLPALIAAEAYWGLIYCETGSITEQHVWYVAEGMASRWDRAFFQAVDKALEASRVLRASPSTAALGAFYAGLARGVRGRLYALRQQSLKAASDGKQLRADLLEAARGNPQLVPDAYLGLGAYNYYADVLSPWLKVIRFFLGVPGGDRKEGLEQLRLASEQARLVAPAAKFELARIYGIRESLAAESFRLFRELSERYPENALYALSAGYQAEGAGLRSTAIAHVRKALEAAQGMEGDCQQRFGKAARGALRRWQEGAPAGKPME